MQAETRNDKKRARPNFREIFPKVARRYLPPLIAFALTILVWEIGSRLSGIPAFILPTPLSIIARFVGELSRIIPAAGVTISEALAGFFLGLVIAVFLAIAFVRFEWLEKSIYPYALASQTIPIVAIAPLLIIWFGFGRTSKVVIAALLTFFPVLVNLVTGLRSLDPEAMDLFKSYGASDTQILIRLRIPNSLPYLFTGMKIAATLCVMGAVVGEFVGAWEGVGYLITRASFYMDAELTFAVILASSLTAICFFGVVSILERVIVFWKWKV